MNNNRVYEVQAHEIQGQQRNCSHILIKVILFIKKRKREREKKRDGEKEREGYTR